MEEKKHYKLYKSGKLWMTAMISAAVLGSAGIVHADVTSQSSATTPTDTSEVVVKTTDLGKAALTTSQPPKAMLLKILISKKAQYLFQVMIRKRKLQ